MHGRHILFTTGLEPALLEALGLAVAIGQAVAPTVWRWVPEDKKRTSAIT